MGLFKIIRWAAAFVFAAVCHVAIIFPHLLLAWLALRLVVRDSVRRRNALCRCMCWHGYLLAEGLKPILGLRLELEPPAEFPDGAAIVLANHVSTLDIVFVFWALHRLGLRQPRWIMKSELRFTPWAIAAAGGSGFVRRRRNAGDFSVVERCGALATQDGGLVVLFPEGTRFRGVSADGAWRHLGPPKPGGFAALRRQMPHAPVLSLTLRWAGGRGRTAFSADGLVGLTVRIAAQTVPAPVVDADPDWLLRHWREKDAALSAASAP